MFIVMLFIVGKVKFVTLKLVKYPSANRVVLEPIDLPVPPAIVVASSVVKKPLPKREVAVPICAEPLEPLI